MKRWRCSTYLLWGFGSIGFGAVLLAFVAVAYDLDWAWHYADRAEGGPSEELPVEAGSVKWLVLTGVLAIGVWLVISVARRRGTCQSK